MKFLGVFVAILLHTSLISVCSKSIASDTTESRIINGEFAKEGQFPYWVRVIAYGGPWSETGIHSCGGSIIAPRWVLTAGHCYVATTNASEPITYHIEAGSIIRWQPRQSDIVINDHAFLHPNYSRETLDYDVSLLRTKRFTFDEYVFPIKIAPGYWNSESYVGENVTVMGMGDITNEGPSPTELRYTVLTVIPRDVCEKAYQDDGDDRLAVPVFCVQDENVPISGFCHGDSGGPGVIKKGGKLIQVGLVSFSMNSGCTAGPQGFVDVAALHDWITFTMARNA